MIDRELLEAAAKAAGMEIHPLIEGKDCLAIIDPSGYWGNKHKYWNPLIDDGDALRLAVKLNMHVIVDGEHNHVRVYARSWAKAEDDYGTADWNDCDKYAATRRAIVLAAAEIGKVMR